MRIVSSSHFSETLASVEAMTLDDTVNMHATIDALEEAQIKQHEQAKMERSRHGS